MGADLELVLDALDAAADCAEEDARHERAGSEHERDALAMRDDYRELLGRILEATA